jgi:hypothetical protein
MSSSFRSQDESRDSASVRDVSITVMCAAGDTDYVLTDRQQFLDKKSQFPKIVVVSEHALCNEVDIVPPYLS